MKHNRNEGLFGRWLAFLLLCLLGGGGLTADAAERAWAKYDDATTTLTFFYGEKGELGSGEYEMNKGTNDPGWDEHSKDITRVVFDTSFAKYQPVTCYSWFSGCSNLTTIEGMENLNTSNVTSMEYMFSGCSSLTGLDLSGFSTGSVTNMRNMFYG